MTNFYKFSIYELLKFCHILKKNTRYCVTHVEIMTLLYIHTHTHTHTHTYTYTHTDLNFAIFWKNRKIKYTSHWDNTGPRKLIHAKFKLFNENIRSTKDSGQIKLHKLKYFHYLNEMIENARCGSSFLVKFHASSQNYFKGLTRF